MYHITCNTDDNYSQHCMAMLCSLFENNKNESFTIHILCKSLSDYNQKSLIRLTESYEQKIIFHIVDDSPLDGVQFRINRPLTKAAYYRLLLSSILKDIDEVLYLDCDVIILGKVRELFDLEIKNYALAAVIDGMPYNTHHQMQLHLPVNAHCFCSGIMLINLSYWRTYNIESKLLDFAKRKRTPVYLHDQDVLNHVLANQWFMLPPKWNVNVMSIKHSPYLRFYHYEEMIFNPAVIHYCSGITKPWYKAPCPGKFYYKHYLKLSKYEYASFKQLSTKQYLKCVYSYIRIYSISKILPLTPRIIVLIIDDIYSIIQLILFILGWIFLSRKKFTAKLKTYYSKKIAKSI